jgi:hypothetical protein
VSILSSAGRVSKGANGFVQALGDTVIIGLFEATPYILAPITAQGKPFLAHGNSQYLRLISTIPDRGSACKTEQISFRYYRLGACFGMAFLPQ